MWGDEWEAKLEEFTATPVHLRMEMWRELRGPPRREVLEGGRWERKGETATDYNKRQEENGPQCGGGERLWALSCQPASSSSLQRNVHFSPMLEGEAFCLEKMRSLLSSAPNQSWVEDKSSPQSPTISVSHSYFGLLVWFKLQRGSTNFITDRDGKKKKTNEPNQHELCTLQGFALGQK